VRDQTIVVTGGGSGIGRAVALLAAARGALVGVMDLDAGAAEAVAVTCRERGSPASAAFGCDVTSEADVTRAFASLAKRLSPPAGLFTSAGIDRGGFAHELPVEVWDRVLATNLSGTFLAARAAIQAMLQAGNGGSIVLCSSPAAFAGFSAGAASAYTASKGGVSALVRSLAVDYASHGIRVNAVVPGPTETPLMWANVSDAERVSVEEAVRAEVPMGRLADPEEPAQAVIWLLSGDSSYVTGSHLVCDGGVLAKASISV
jgi:NAD(P)-dependent dehydrogenase (short-subunit alcohol dehydrogenase family)